MKWPVHASIYDKGVSHGWFDPVELVKIELPLSGLIVSQHGGSSREIDFSKAVRGLSQRPVAPAKDIFEIERDKGADELAHSVGRLLSSRFNTRIAVAEVLQHRAVVDSNRRNESLDCADGRRRFAGVSDIYRSYGDYLAAMNSGLVAEYVQIRAALRGLVGLVVRGGVVLDMHTMWPYSLTANVPLTGRASISNRVAAHTSPDNWKELRRCIVVPGDPQINTGVGDVALAENLIDSMNAGGFPTSSVGAYGPSDLVGTLTEDFFREAAARGARAAVMDVPKHLVYGTSPKSYATREYGNAAPPPVNRVQAVSEAVFGAILKTVR